ncbi:hypothetical protein BDZ94DRAFT_1270067 [Collybia nuda]|uniref:Uncharacterized protein n=1 Tax=Collybia nuda TaxID=64659 RepID=A0A9P6CE13_9AGAR|nr:hypothetical protein BDZ94DRAFT_1270067 [Collybia nuda]
MSRVHRYYIKESNLIDMKRNCWLRPCDGKLVRMALSVDRLRGRMWRQCKSTTPQQYP